MTATESNVVADLTGENIEVENIYDEIEIDDMDWDEELRSFLYPCPCGDKFRISLEQLRKGETIGICPSCSL